MTLSRYQRRAVTANPPGGDLVEELLDPELAQFGYQSAVR